MRKFILGIVAAACCAGASAQTVVFDPANFAQNLISAAKAAEATVQRATSYLTQLQQYKVQLQQLAQLNPQTVSSLVTQNSAETAQALKFVQAAQQVYGDVTQSRNTFQGRLDQAKALGKDWNSYLAWEQSRINRNVEAAVARADQEKQMNEKVKRDLEYANEAAKPIDSNDSGVHASMMNVNMQLNRLIQQQADFTRVMSGSAASAGLAVEEAAQQNDADQAALARQAQLEEMQKAKKEAEDRVRQSLRSGS